MSTSPNAEHETGLSGVRPLTVHLVSHTHWDREWYHVASAFRQRLVPLIDALLHAPTSSFLLDGQCVVLNDYLAVRPEQETSLRERLGDGSLEVGPWYVLADNLIPSGEAMLRNLEAGARILSRLGGHAPQAAYCPDTFGHPAMLPAIATGYGFLVAIVWRGFGGAQHPHTDAFWWSSPDGSRVLAYHLAPDGYESGSALPTSVDAAAERWRVWAPYWRVINRSGVVLLPNGADHHARQRQRAASVAVMAQVAHDHGATLIDSSLGAFAAALQRAVTVAEIAAQDSNAKGFSTESRMQSVQGELRDSYGYAWTLQGTFATRAAQKRTNARLERALLADVEPWLALAWLHGKPEAFAVSPDARVTLAQLPSLLHHAWETLLRTHPHDTLCGCSIDAVAAAMRTRQRATTAQIGGLREGALQLALDHDPATARDQVPLVDAPVVIRNRVSYARSGIAEIRLLDLVRDEPVGPGSSTNDRVANRERMAISAIAGVLHQEGRSRLRRNRRESPQHYPDNDLVIERRVVAWVPEVPTFGVSILRTHNERDVSRDRSEPRPSHPVSLTVVGDAYVLDNGIVRVSVTSSGVTLAVGDRTVSDALRIESTDDLGDSYTPSLRGEPQPLRVVAVRAGAAGPLRASVTLDWELPAQRHRGRVCAETTLILDANSEMLRCDITGRNHRRDHRLRMHWRTDQVSESTASAAAPSVVHADAAFGPVRRNPIVASESAQAVELVLKTMPLHRWVSVSQSKRGVALISDGLAEVEANERAIAVTLLRAIGELSRADLPERPGHAGWPSPIPTAQSHGRFRARVGILLHLEWGNDALLSIERRCDDLLLPLVGESWRDYSGAVRTLDGAQLVGNGLRASAATLSRDGTALLLRVSNITNDLIEGAWILPSVGPFTVTPCRLDETPIAPSYETTSRIPLHVPPRALVTVCVRRDPGAHHQ